MYQYASLDDLDLKCDLNRDLRFGLFRNTESDFDFDLDLNRLLK